jgi:hypothetical protein
MRGCCLVLGSSAEQTEQGKLESNVTPGAKSAPLNMACGVRVPFLTQVAHTFNRWTH